MILNLGFVEYGEAYRLQRMALENRRSGRIGDTLILAEHPSVFTVGRTGSLDNLLRNEKNIPVIRVDRGGDVTYHGPGQLVAYPIIDLKALGLDLHAYLRLLESAGILFIGSYGIDAGRIACKTGVWVEDRKIASIGVSASGWVTFHGMSVNLNVDLEYFSMINPCGMKGVKVTSLERELGHKISITDARTRITDSFGRLFYFGDKDGCANRRTCASLA